MQYLKNDVREKILKAAIAEFKENGYANASIRNIAVNAHISLGNIYRYFTNKEALYCAVVEPLMEEIVRKIDSEFEHGNVEAKDVSDATVDFIWENRDKLDIINQGNTAFFESFRKMLVDMVKLSLNKLIINRYPTLLTKIKNPNFFSTIAAGFLHCLNMVALNGEDYETQKRNVKELVVFFFERMEERFENF